MVVFALIVLLVLIFWVIPALRSRSGSGHSRPPMDTGYLPDADGSFSDGGHHHSSSHADIGSHGHDAGGHDGGGDAGGADGGSSH